MADDDDIKLERVHTVGMKRRSVVRVLKTALHDAQREIATDRVVGIFGVVIKEDGTASLLSALTVDELRIVMKAMPEALNRVAMQIMAGADKESSH
jgi:hypothetical protein